MGKRQELEGTVTALRRTYRGEERWFPLLEEHGHTLLRRGFIACGVSPAASAGLVFFLDDQLLLERHQSEHARVRYRAILRDLDPELVSRAIGGLFNSRRRAA